MIIFRTILFYFGLLSRCFKSLGVEERI